MGKAVRTLRTFCLFCFPTTVVAVSLARLPGVDKLAFVIMSAFMLGVTEYGFRKTSHSELFSVVYATVAGYLWFAYPGKLALMLYESDSSWINTVAFLADPPSSELLTAFLQVGPALIALLLGLATGRVARAAPRWTTHQRASSAVGIVALLVAKVVMQASLSIAVPGVQPKALGIPFAAGVLAFMVGLPLAALVNIYLFHALVDEDRPRIRRGLFLVLGLVLSDLWVGYKLSLVMQAAVMWYYWSAVRPRTSVRTRRLLGVFLATNMIGMLVLYKYVNEYRFALLGGVDVRSAIRAAGAPPSAHRTGSVFSIVSRINGIDNYYVATRMGSIANYEVGTLFDQSLGASFNRVLFSRDDVNTNFGLTQFGALYVVGGQPLAVLGAFLLGWFVRLNSGFILRRVLKSSSWAVAFTPVLALWYVRLLFAGGELMLFAKELLVTCLVVAFVHRLTTVKPDRAPEADPIRRGEPSQHLQTRISH